VLVLLLLLVPVVTGCKGLCELKLPPFFGQVVKMEVIEYDSSGRSPENGSTKEESF